MLTDDAAMTENARTTPGQRVMVFGASGTIGQAAVRQLLEAGHDVTKVLRQTTMGTPPAALSELPGCTAKYCDFADPGSASAKVFEDSNFDVVVSCLASRSGAPEDARFVDYECNMQVLRAAKAAGVRHMILISAICVQKPELAFQFAKLDFEAELIASGLTYTIIRPTAFFKSLSGQIARVHRGKPFMVFGNGELTRCKPIGDDDLGRFIAACIADPGYHDRIVPIGGPGPAISPMQQGEILFGLLERTPRYRRIPIGLLSLAVNTLSALNRISRRAAPAAEYARIARYYATESMLVIDPKDGCYSAEATPQFGTQTLAEHYRAQIAKLADGGLA